MSEIVENITCGLIISVSNEVVDDEPITLEETKSYMGIYFDAHDDKINRLITACRVCLEKLASVTLITSRDVEVVWREMYDWEDLPYSNIDKDGITITDLDDVVIDSPKFVSAGGKIKLYGSFSNGVKLLYQSTTIAITDAIREGLIRAVKDCFEKDMPVDESIKKEFQYVNVN